MNIRKVPTLYKVILCQLPTWVLLYIFFRLHSSCLGPKEYKHSEPSFQSAGGRLLMDSSLILEDVYMEGGDLIDFVAKSAVECHLKCEDTPECVGWSFMMDEGKCYLKERYTLRVPKQFATTGILSRGCNQFGTETSCSQLKRCKWCDYGDGIGGFCGLDSDFERDACIAVNDQKIVDKRKAYKVAIISMFEGRSKETYYNMTNGIKKAYAKRHNYDYYDVSLDFIKTYIKKHPDLDQDLEKKGAFFHKMLALLSKCETHDWVMWQDADSYFLNHNFRLTDLFKDEYHAIFPALHHRPDHPHNYWINGGNFLIRCSPIGKELLKEAYNSTAWDDQIAFKDCVDRNSTYANTTVFVQHRLINSMPECDWSEKDFVIHFPGPRWDKLDYLEEIKHMVSY